ncbi:MAG: hypothetical protein ACKPHU_21220, partial [Planctomycetaceae bacterium]
RASAVRADLERDGFTILEGALAGEPIRDFAAGVAAMFGPHVKPGEDVLTACDRIGREDNDLLYRHPSQDPVLNPYPGKCDCPQAAE